MRGNQGGGATGWIKGDLDLAGLELGTHLGTLFGQGIVPMAVVGAFALDVVINDAGQGFRRQCLPGNLDSTPNCVVKWPAT